MNLKLATVMLSGILAVPVLGQASDAQPDVSGTWVGSAGKMILTEKDGKLHMQAFNGNSVASDYTCALDGAECAIKEAGHAEKVMVYFNGPKLVEIKERGSDTGKRRFSLSPDGKTLQVEVVPLNTDQKAETLTFQRQDSANGKSSS